VAARADFGEVVVARTGNVIGVGACPFGQHDVLDRRAACALADASARGMLVT
jgi:hypothetical protein